MQHREEREPQDRRHQSTKARKTRRSLVASPKRPADMGDSVKRPFRCDTCGKRFIQTQGRNRHFREKHDPDLCVFCDFEWGRPCQYRDHLETHHPDVDPETIIGKTKGSRCRAASFARNARQQVLPLTIEHHGRGHAETGSYPPMMPPPVVAKLSTVTIPRTMSRKISPEGATNFALLFATYAHNTVSAYRRACPSELDRAKLVGLNLEAFGPVSAPLDGCAAHPALIPSLSPPVDGTMWILWLNQLDPCTLVRSPLLALRDPGKHPRADRADVEFGGFLGCAQSGILNHIRLDGTQGRESRGCSLLLDRAGNQLRRYRYPYHRLVLPSLLIRILRVSYSFSFLPM